MERLALMPKYEAYKNSGVEWLGAIPVHWNSFPLCAKSKLKSISNNENEELLSVYLDKGVIKFDDIDAKRTNATSSDLTKYQLVEPGDFVLNNQQAWRGSVGVSDYRGIVSPAYLVLSLSEDIVPRFGNYLFRDGAMVANYLVSSKGVGTIQRNLYWLQLKRALVFLPPTEEQLLIACFLDKKTAQIDEAIAIKEQQISLLKERKQIIIQQAVTQGLDPNVPMKDSGVDWIGKIPAHWEVSKLKNIFIFGKGLTITKEHLRDNGIPCVNYGEIHSKYGFEVDPEKHLLKCVENDYLRTSRGALLKYGDFVFADTSEDIEGAGNFTYLNSAETVFAGYHTVTAKLKVEVNTRYLAYALDSLSFRMQIRQKVKGVKVYSITQAILKNIIMWFPSDKEQSEIADFLDREILQVAEALKLQLAQIEKLKEYKTTLINSAVTGKIKITPEMVEQ